MDSFWSVGRAFSPAFWSHMSKLLVETVRDTDESELEAFSAKVKESITEETMQHPYQLACLLCGMAYHKQLLDSPTSDDLLMGPLMGLAIISFHAGRLSKPTLVFADAPDGE